MLNFEFKIFQEFNTLLDNIFNVLFFNLFSQYILLEYSKNITLEHYFYLLTFLFRKVVYKVKN